MARLNLGHGGWSAALLRLSLAAVAVLALAAAAPAGASEEREAFRTAIEPLFRALADLQLVAIAGASSRQITEVQSAVFHERERLHARYGDDLAAAPEPAIARALETAYLSFTFYGLLVGQFGAATAAQNATADRHFQRGVAAMETIERFLRSP